MTCFLKIEFSLPNRPTFAHSQIKLPRNIRGTTIVGMPKHINAKVAAFVSHLHSLIPQSMEDLVSLFVNQLDDQSTSGYQVVTVGQAKHTLMVHCLSGSIFSRYLWKLVGYLFRQPCSFFFLLLGLLNCHSNIVALGMGGGGVIRNEN